MSPEVPRSAGTQAGVDRWFDERASYWRDVYAAEGLQGLIYRQRMERMLQWMEDSALPAGAAALEVGCGAGLLTVEMARRGFQVTSTDASPEMVNLTRSRVAQEGFATGVSVQVADVHQLPFADGEFEVVAALGVLPWLHSPQRAVAEMARVLAPGGLLLMSADNQLRLNALVGQNPLLELPKWVYYRLMRARGRVVPERSRLHTPRAVGRLLSSAGLRPLRRATIGFGPITLAGRPVLGEALSLRLHSSLQAESDRGQRVIQNMGAHYLVVAGKS